jgi:transcriptional regulator with XRE-family HTH domain
VARVGGKPGPDDLSAAEVFARRMTEVRKGRGWTAKELARRLAEAGHVISRGRIAKLETGGTQPTISDLFAIAYVLDTSPLFLLAPLERKPDVIFVGGVQPAAPDEIRAWLRGEAELLNQNPKVFAVERPGAERQEALARLPEPVAAEIIERGATRILKEEQ